MRRYKTLLLAVLLLAAVLTGCGDQRIEDGTYSVNVTLSGGSGKATVESPAIVLFSDGKATARIVWSSPFYEYMMVDGVKYDPVQTSGNAVFEIPVKLDTDLPVSASTIAMSQPHLVDYTLHFESKGMKEVTP